MAFGLRNPSYFNQDLSLVRKFAVVERLSVSLGADVFNIFNNVVLRRYFGEHHLGQLRPRDVAGQCGPRGSVKDESRI